MPPATTIANDTDPAAPRTAARRRGLVALLVALAGVLMGLGMPGQPVPGVWVVIYVPLFLALELTLRAAPAGFWPRLWRMVACSYPVGVLAAMLSGDWVVNTAHVYGFLPKPVAYLAAWFGYGSLLGVEIAGFLGLAYWLCYRRPLWALVLVPLWATVGQVFVPRFLFWTFGQFVFTEWALAQPAALLGSGALNFLVLPLHLVLALWVLRVVDRSGVALRPLVAATAVAAVLLASAWGYGAQRLAQGPAQDGTPVQLVGIQPDFSLKHLASNPALSPSDREQNLATLLSDSATALAAHPAPPGMPRVLVWPESVYPQPFRFAPEARAQVEAFVRAHGVHLVLASLDARFQQTAEGTQREVYGVSLHLTPDGRHAATYRKIQLMPFGEYIPFAKVVPGLRWLIKSWIPQISEFERGRDATAFSIEGGPPLAPMICFDATVQDVALRMARNGARVGLVLANLAWFGSTSVSDQFELFARFRALETGMPMLLLSQNGGSSVLDALGTPVARLGQFETGALAPVVRAGRATPFVRLSRWVHAAYPLLLVLTLAVVHRRWLMNRAARMRRRRA